MPSEFESSVKEFMNSQKNFNALLEEKLLKVDDLAKNVDRLSLDVDSLKLRSIPPKHGINESLKAREFPLMSARKEPLGCVLPKMPLLKRVPPIPIKIKRKI